MPNPGRLHTRFHLYVHEEILKQLVRGVDVRTGRVRTHLMKDVGYQGISLEPPHSVIDRLNYITPVRGGVAGAKRGLQSAHYVASRLVRGGLDQCSCRNTHLLRRCEGLKSTDKEFDPTKVSYATTELRQSLV